MIHRRKVPLEIFCCIRGAYCAVRRRLPMIARPVSIWLSCFLLLISNTNVHSRDSELPVQPERNDTVATRLHPELEPLGLTAGSFLIYPKLGYKLSYDDNIFATDDPQISDTISVVSPAIAMASDLTRHAVNLSASADLGRYRDFSSEDYDDWQVSGNVRLDSSHASRILFGAVYAHLHEPRDSPDSSGGVQPGIFTSSLANLDLTFHGGTFSFSPTANYQRLEYDDVVSLLLGVLPVVIKQDDRDRTQYILGLRGAYDVGPDHYAFLRVRSFTTDYDRLQQVTGFDRSSDGYEIAAGAALDFGGITRGRFFIGYRTQEYIDPLPDISAPVFGIDLVWKPSELTSVEFDAGRDFRETTAFVYSGYISTSTHIKVDHELRRNLRLNAALGYTGDDYEGIASASREDKTIHSRLGISWLINRNMIVSLSHEFTDRETTDSTIPAGFPGDDFRRHIGWARIELQK